MQYVALAHNEWDPHTRRSKGEGAVNFGRENRVDRDALARLVASINRYLGVDDSAAAQRLHAVASLYGMRPFVEQVEVMAPQQCLQVRLKPRVAGGIAVSSAVSA